MEQSQNSIINITSFKLGLYRFRFLPVSVNEITIYAAMQYIHFFNRAMLACNQKNNDLDKQCAICTDTYQLYLDERFDEAKALYPRDVYFSTVSSVDSQGNMSQPFVLKYSRQLYMKIEKTQKKYGSICDPNGGYLFDVVIRLKDDKKKWKTYEDSEVHNGQPFPLTSFDWTKLILNPRIGLIKSLPFKEGLEFYLSRFQPVGNGGYSNPALARRAPVAENSQPAQAAQPAYTPPDTDSLPGGDNSAYVAPVGTNYPGSGAPIAAVAPVAPVVAAVPVAPKIIVAPVVEPPVVDNSPPWESPTGIDTTVDGKATMIPSCHASIPGKPGYRPGDRACAICAEQKTCVGLKLDNADGVAPLKPVTPVQPVNPVEPVQPVTPESGTNFPDVSQVSDDVKSKIDALNKD